MPLLHLGGTTPTSVTITVGVIFFLIFALSFAVGKVPEGGRRFSGEWIRAWTRASVPRLLVAAAFSGLILVGALVGGKGVAQPATAASCNKAVPPLTGQAVTDQRLLAAVDGMHQIAQAARDKDIGRVQTLFFGNDAHNVTHDIDAPLRTADPTLARNLCLSVVIVENQMVSSLDTAVIARESDNIAEDLNQARTALNLAGSATPTVVIGSGYCLQPVGALSTEALTADPYHLRRLQAPRNG